uniref:Uncharacterized protein n=1 Tax=Brassica oleracea TaxID=3712 RepID=A0A3P6DWL1_BRAOL|nr:unnamed protein product [Brassica oleracea]
MKSVNNLRSSTSMTMQQSPYRSFEAEPIDRCNSHSRYTSHLVLTLDTTHPPKLSPNSKAKNKQKKQEDPPFDEMGFTSTVIVPDEPSVSKLTPQTKQPSPPVVKPEDGEGKTPKKIELALRRYRYMVLNFEVSLRMCRHYMLESYLLRKKEKHILLSPETRIQDSHLKHGTCCPVTSMYLVEQQQDNEEYESAGMLIRFTGSTTSILGIRSLASDRRYTQDNEVKVWEDPWIPTTPARHARPLAPVLNPNMRVIDFINQDTKEWDVGLLQNYVHPEDIPLIRSMSISSAHRRDTFCWSYTKSGIYTVKSGYWVASNLMQPE